MGGTRIMPNNDPTPVEDTSLPPEVLPPPADLNNDETDDTDLSVDESE